MPTPKAGYYTKDGKRVPGTTTILGRFKDSGGLIHWSWDVAHSPLMEARALIEGLTNGSPNPEAAKAFLARPVESFDYRHVRDTAANAGTCAHDMVECFIRKRPFEAAKYPPEILEKAKPAFDAFQEWAGNSKLESFETEVSIVSEKHRFGGTLDAMLVGNKLSLGDWKSSNAIYPEYLCQLAAYGKLWEEAHPDLPIEGGFHLLRFSKQDSPDDPVNFVHHFWSHLDKAWQAFIRMRDLYDLMAGLKKLAA